MGGLVKSVVGAVTSIVSSVFGGAEQGGQTQAPPEVKQPTVMPTPDDEAIQAAKKKSIAAVVGRQGRASTILSGDGGGTLGI